MEAYDMFAVQKTTNISPTSEPFGTFRAYPLLPLLPSLALLPILNPLKAVETSQLIFACA